MTLPLRRTVRIVLLNEADELLLMCMDDPEIRSIGSLYGGHFWTLIGGEIEVNETLLDAAARELFEETDIGPHDVEFGPVVWQGDLDLILHGVPAHIEQQFIVARTLEKTTSLANLTPSETVAVRQLAWFSLPSIVSSAERIYPVLLPDYLPDVIAGQYPQSPILIDLAVQPRSQWSQLLITGRLPARGGGVLGGAVIS
jgi:ADP-ribose pyrophosphatase YjhB (NUDIX family)